MKRFLCLLLCIAMLPLVPATAFAASVDLVSDKFSNGLAVIKQNGKYGYLDTTGTIAIQPQWDDAQPFSEGFAVIKSNEKYGYINKSGETISEAMWDSAHSFSEGRAAVEKNGRWGFINATGTVVIAPQWSYVKDFSDGAALVRDRVTSLYGFIDAQGNILGEIKWENAQPHSHGLAAVEYGNLWGFVNAKGEVVVQPQYVEVEDFIDDQTWAITEDIKGNKKFHAINTQGKTLFSASYDEVGHFSEGYAVVEKGDDRYIINKNGKKVFNAVLIDKFIPYGSSYISQSQDVYTTDYFQNGLISVTQFFWQGRSYTKTEGLCNTKGTLVLDCVWKRVYPFSDGLARVETESSSGKPLFGYVNKTGTLVIKEQYDKAGDFSDGYAIVWKGSTWYIINKTGKVVF